ncbi:unnamed protein product [Pleuronectes platessa]|uniref:Cadherin domain-containing protein n=1 Tax=Pleuronectes platessa TaxID=8262 RepID=A0A9N7TS45_PLEPL|nr:unnamed protein product [Pleuronectes platessa]
MEGSLGRRADEVKELDVSTTDFSGNLVDGPTSLLITVIDQNDNRPIFKESRYSGEVLEGSPTASSLYLKQRGSTLHDLCLSLRTSRGPKFLVVQCFQLPLLSRMVLMMKLGKNQLLYPRVLLLFTSRVSPLIHRNKILPLRSNCQVSPGQITDCWQQLAPRSLSICRLLCCRIITATYIAGQGSHPAGMQERGEFYSPLPQSPTSSSGLDYPSLSPSSYSQRLSKSSESRRQTNPPPIVPFFCSSSSSY